MTLTRKDALKNYEDCKNSKLVENLQETYDYLFDQVDHCKKNIKNQEDKLKQWDEELQQTDDAIAKGDWDKFKNLAKCEDVFGRPL